MGGGSPNKDLWCFLFNDDSHSGMNKALLYEYQTLEKKGQGGMCCYHRHK